MSRTAIISPRPWTTGCSVDSTGKPTGSYPLFDANRRCIGMATSEDDARTIVEAVNGFSTPAEPADITDADIAAAVIRLRVLAANNGGVLRGSTSFLQRQMQSGYGRARRIIEALEARGIISPPDTKGQRTFVGQLPERI
jgi:DNA segregation ATPase FtsK/SpoIIIE-like protein